MKNVGLITFHRPVNYGAALQTVALSKTIDSLGAVCNLIDYRNPFFEKMYSPFKMPASRSLKSIAWAMLSLPYKMRQKSGFAKFISENTHLTKAIKNKAELSMYGNQYDLYITGSDQVFNLQCSGGETAYFLDFVQGKPKYSYAASLGDANISEESAVSYKNLLSDFCHISMREQSGANVIENITGKQCACMLDPTLLLNKTQWQELVKDKPSLLKERYVLVYFMAASKAAREEMMQVAKTVAAKKDCQVLLIGGSMHKRKNGIHYVNPTSPYQFLSLFRDASYVVTNSFHGTAFALNFEKPFFSYVKPDLQVSGRVESLLEIVQLKERIFSAAGDVSERDFALDFDEARQLLDAERSRCKEYLRGIIHG